MQLIIYNAKNQTNVILLYPDNFIAEYITTTINKRFIFVSVDILSLTIPEVQVHFVHCEPDIQGWPLEDFELCPLLVSRQTVRKH